MSEPPKKYQANLVNKQESKFLPLFACPFGYNNFGESARELNKKLIEDIEKEKNKSKGKFKTFSKNQCGWQSENGLELKYESFKELSKLIYKASMPIIHNSGIHPEDYKRYVLNNFWANIIFAAGGFSSPHIHGSGQTVWTGVYYPKGLEEIKNLDIFDINKYFQYQVNETPGSLILKDPSGISKRVVRVPLRARQYYSHNFSVVPRQSLLVLFPAYMEHYVTPTIDNSKRYSISFAIKRQDL